MPKNITDNRRSIRLRGYDYSQCGGYFVTLCTFQKKCLLGDVHNGAIHLNRSGRTVTMEWLKAEEIRDNVYLDAFVAMPNHFHGIIFLTDAGMGGASRHRVSQRDAR